MKKRNDRNQGRKLKTTPILSVLAATLLAALPAVNATAAQTLSDADIRDVVEDELIYDQAVPEHHITVIVTDGVVTLTGSVDNLLAKERAADVAETVKGVRATVNRLDVDPAVNKADEVIKADVKNALLSDPATEFFDVDVKVSNGVVTLSGNVESWQEWRLSAIAAKGVAGVENVQNDIVVDYGVKRSDSEIEADIEGVLRWDALVDHALIDVQVDDGAVRLRGAVGSAAEKSRAGDDAWVTGVKTVDATGLDVKIWARTKKLRENKYVIKSDAEIKKAVDDALMYDPRVDGADVTVDVEGGEVTLRGSVSHLKAKRAAGRDAANTVGALRLNNRLRVRPAAAATDAALEARLMDALDRDPYLESYEISVDVVNNEANLYGTVDSYFEKGRADDTAARVNGVIAVDNHLTVNDANDPYAFDPYVDRWSVYDYDWYNYSPGYTFKSDFNIRLDIVDEMFWSPFVDADQVAVAVDDGVATLTGTVNSWSEYYAASENALEGGAIKVNNELRIEPESS